MVPNTRCEACNERFYDLNRSPVICFKCGAAAVAAKATDVSTAACRVGPGRVQPASAAGPAEKLEPADDLAVEEVEEADLSDDEDADLDDDAEVEIEVEIDPEDGKIIA